MQTDIIRIALIGPESSGKTTLATQLAAYYHTVWVKEFAREYIASLGRNYNYDDVLFCIQSQMEEEARSLKTASRYLFADTELILHKVWLDDVFKTYPPELDNMVEANRYDLYLLCSPDLPFIHDPVRENPHRREYFFDLYKRELDARKFSYSVISGNNRLEKAIAAIDRLE